MTTTAQPEPNSRPLVEGIGRGALLFTVWAACVVALGAIAGLAVRLFTLGYHLAR